MTKFKFCLAGFAALGLATATPAFAKDKDHDYPEARNYDASIDATATVDSALERAKTSNKLVLIAMGANWCHDSRAFAGWMETERFAELIDLHFELVHVNIGMPQTKDGHNLHIAERFGVTDIEGDARDPDHQPLWRSPQSRDGQKLAQHCQPRGERDLRGVGGICRQSHERAPRARPLEDT